MCSALRAVPVPVPAINVCWSWDGGIHGKAHSQKGIRLQGMFEKTLADFFFHASLLIANERLTPYNVCWLDQGFDGN